MQNNDGDTPLSVAAKRDASAEVVDALVVATFSALSIEDETPSSVVEASLLSWSARKSTLPDRTAAMSSNLRYARLSSSMPLSFEVERLRSELSKAEKERDATAEVLLFLLRDVSGAGERVAMGVVEGREGVVREAGRGAGLVKRINEMNGTGE